MFAPLESQVEKSLEKPYRKFQRKDRKIPDPIEKAETEWTEKGKHQMGCRDFNDGRGGAAAAPKART